MWQRGAASAPLVNTSPTVGVYPDGKLQVQGGGVAESVDFGLRIGERRAVAAPVMEISEDAQLVIAARDGDRAAFGRLYRRYARMVHGILLARVPRSDADDLAQDVFLLALRRLAALRDPAAFGGWLGAIARNRANDYHRGHLRRGEENEELDENTAARAAGDRDRGGQPDAEAAAALEAIRGLPEAYRETLILRLVEGMTGPEIAARTGLTPGSVRVNLCRGMQQLREKLGIAPGESGRREEEAL
ncbi:MAG TPA: RNA polymerase sigma factor [Terriglobia bacterium]|nr:RNA polymerase sigma factor [Terriglobia bacterium]